MVLNIEFLDKTDKQFDGAFSQYSFYKEYKECSKVIANSMFFKLYNNGRFACLGILTRRKQGLEVVELYPLTGWAKHYKQVNEFLNYLGKNHNYKNIYCWITTEKVEKFFLKHGWHKHNGLLYLKRKG